MVDSPSQIAAYEARYMEALAALRRDDPALAEAAYLGKDNAAAADRFMRSVEFAETISRMRAAGLPAGGSLLEIGAGNGMASVAFAAQGLRVVALDPCNGEEYGAAAIARLAGRMNAPVEVAVGFGESLPFADASFDAAYMRQCLHHAADLRLMVREASRALKPGGLFFAVREHVVSNDAQLDKFLAAQPMHQLGGTENARRLGEYLDAIRGAGLEILSVLRPYDTEINLYPDSMSAAQERWRERCARLIGRRFSGCICRTGIFRDALRRAMNLAMRRPGRMYSFLAKKRRCT